MSTRTRPPGPKAGILGLDFLAQFKDDALKTATKLKREFGDCIYVKAGPYDWFMFNHPDQVRDVLVTKAKAFTKTETVKRVFRSVDGNGLFVSEGDFWSRQRRTINPAFNHATIASYAEIMRQETEQFISQWEPGQTLDLADEMTKLTLTIAARLFFSADVKTKAKELGDAVTTISRTMLQELYAVLPIPDWFPLPSKQEKKTALATINNLIHKCIAEHLENPDRYHDVLSMLLTASDPETGEGMTTLQVRDEAITLFNAGHDSTAAGLSWAWYLLLQNPSAYDRLLSDGISSVVSNPVSQTISSTGSNATAEQGIGTHASQIAKEALRLYPPAWGLSRQCLQDTELAGFVVPKSSLVFLCPYVIQRDGRFFDEPEVFNPERFSDENERKLHPFAYIPFGAGARACIGREMALTEMSIVLYTISKRFKFEFSPTQEPIEPVALISLEQKNGVKAIVRRK